MMGHPNQLLEMERLGAQNSANVRALAWAAPDTQAWMAKPKNGCTPYDMARAKFKELLSRADAVFDYQGEVAGKSGYLRLAVKKTDFLVDRTGVKQEKSLEVEGSQKKWDEGKLLSEQHGLLTNMDQALGSSLMGDDLASHLVKAGDSLGARDRAILRSAITISDPQGPRPRPSSFPGDPVTSQKVAGCEKEDIELCGSLR